MKKILFSLLALILLGTLGFFYFAYSAEFSEGSRAGRVTKFSKKGFIFKTYEGQLNVGGISTSKGGGVASIWDFSVDESEQEVIKAIEEAMTNDSYVKLYYEEKFFKFTWRGDTKYFVVKVEAPKNSTEQSTNAPEQAYPAAQQ